MDIRGLRLNSTVFPMLEILEIYIRYLPLENSLLNRKKSGMETE